MTDIDNLEFLELPKTKTDTNIIKPIRLTANVLIVGILIMVIIKGLQLSQPNVARPTSGPTPNFSPKLFDGSDFQLSNYRGQVGLINFWDSWCGPYRQEAPELQMLYETYQFVIRFTKYDKLSPVIESLLAGSS